jgi:hypothetical protein
MIPAGGNSGKRVRRRWGDEFFFKKVLQVELWSVIVGAEGIARGDSGHLVFTVTCINRKTAF